MPTSQEQIDNFIEAHYRNAISKQQLVVDGAKAVALFSSGVAATFTATALQIGTFGTADTVTVALLVLAFLLTLLVFVLDNLTDGPNLIWVAAQAAGNLDLHLQELLNGLRVSTIRNKKTVRNVFIMLIVQCLLCLSAIGAAVASLS